MAAVIWVTLFGSEGVRDIVVSSPENEISQRYDRFRPSFKVKWGRFGDQTRRCLEFSLNLSGLF